MRIGYLSFGVALALLSVSCGKEEDSILFVNNVSTNNMAVEPFDSGPTPEELAAARHREEIERILEEDASAGRLGSARQTADAMGRINTDNAPNDFRQAYLLHRQAWENYAVADEQLRYLNSEEARDEAWRRWWIETFRGSNETPVTDLEAAKARVSDRRAAANENIRSTWQRVEQVAVSFGARLARPQDPTSNGM